ncbi:hypothetical protein N658DRAFT_177968 [Parathielavia hyrcaniae]|uniref:Uncharacterized protein n=1 Tax=Parathielavia hyrcaniae TaxID=113614 RepID=A0AAN6T500_9PEZI|nr:hypothetical protein N658DRAFT_177968 [Parathielavia hyrcaniae]
MWMLTRNLKRVDARHGISTILPSFQPYERHPCGPHQEPCPPAACHWIDWTLIAARRIPVTVSSQAQFTTHLEAPGESNGPEAVEVHTILRFSHYRASVPMKPRPTIFEQGRPADSEFRSVCIIQYEVQIVTSGPPPAFDQGPLRCKVGDADGFSANPARHPPGTFSILTISAAFSQPFPGFTFPSSARK